MPDLGDSKSPEWQEALMRELASCQTALERQERVAEMREFLPMALWSPAAPIDKEAVKQWIRSYNPTLQEARLILGHPRATREMVEPLFEWAVRKEVHDWSDIIVKEMLETYVTDASDEWWSLAWNMARGIKGRIVTLDGWQDGERDDLEEVFSSLVYQLLEIPGVNDKALRTGWFENIDDPNIQAAGLACPGLSTQGAFWLLKSTKGLGARVYEETVERYLEILGEKKILGSDEVLTEVLKEGVRTGVVEKFLDALQGFAPDKRREGLAKVAKMQGARTAGWLKTKGAEYVASWDQGTVNELIRSDNREVRLAVLSILAETKNQGETDKTENPSVRRASNSL